MSKRTHRAVTKRSLSARSIALVVALAAGGLLTACGEQPKGQEVASVSGEGTQSDRPQPTAIAASGRPQIRVDTSREEREELEQVWVRCLKDHGAPVNSKIDGKGKEVLAPRQNSRNDPAYREANQACDAKLPVNPPEEDPSTNPNYDDDVREWVQCMRGRGLKITRAPKGSPSDFNYEDPDQMLDAKWQKVMDECKIEAFSAKK
jgi:hypothetical protein